MVAPELGDGLDVWSLAAACACAGELEQRLCELCVLHIAFLVEDVLFVADMLVQPIEVLLLLEVFLVGNHFESFLLCRADIDAVAATCTVSDRN